MDQRLLAWGLRPSIPASRIAGAPRRRRKNHSLPRLWLFTDQQRRPDPRASVARLPIGRAGVVLRHDHDPARVELARDIARICRERRLILVVAGDARLAASVGAGLHLRGGRRPGPVRTRGVLTSSAHSIPDLRRAAAAGAALVFLSPAFATASHAGSPALGPLRWSAMAGALRFGTAAKVAALGGVDGASVRRLPARLLHAAGAIGALSSG